MKISHSPPRRGISLRDKAHDRQRATYFARLALRTALGEVEASSSVKCGSPTPKLACAMSEGFLEPEISGEWQLGIPADLEERCFRENGSKLGFG